LKIIFISYCDSGGGAAKAFYNLCLSCKNDSRNNFLVIEKRSKNKKIYLFKKGFFGKVLRRFRYLIAQVILLNQNLYVMSLNIIKSGLSDFVNQSNFDIVNFHWINCETISISEIRKINKPIVWTFHDMWPISGIYHYDLDKKYFNSNTKSFVKRKYFNFLDNFIKKKKLAIFKEKKINIISPSKWRLNKAKKSNLIYNNAQVIPNPINTNLYNRSKNIKKIKEYYEIPSESNILLYSSLLLSDKRKGFEIINKIVDYKEYQKYIFIFLGISKKINKNEFNRNVKFINETNNEKKIIDLYSISDVLLFPSIIDNMPNTILEGMSCGLPCVAFNCYGMKEIINHKKNGYLAKPYSVKDFKKGIDYIFLNKKKFLREDIRRQIVNNYSFEVIRKKYRNFFKRINNNINGY
jgi:glycosyltransferase involved in cell wall biosynthesis